MSVLHGYPPEAVEALRCCGSVVRGIILDHGVVLAENEIGGPVEEFEPADAFEHWLIERWLKDIRSDEFRHSVQHERLMAEWERGN